MFIGLLESLPLFEIAVNVRYQAAVALTGSALAAMGLERLANRGLGALRGRTIALLLALFVAAILGLALSILRGAEQVQHASRSVRQAKPMPAATRAVLHRPDLGIPGQVLSRSDSAYALTELYEHLPRARIVHSFERITDDDATLARLRDPTFDLRTTCILAESPAAPDPGTSGAAKIRVDTPDRVVVDLANVDGGFLLLADTYYPGWRARVDGVERPILRSNLAQRAVVLAPGDREIEFEFEPASLRIGLAISLAALVGLFTLLALRRRTWTAS